MTDATKVLIISKPTEQALGFRKKLSAIPGYQLTFEETAERAMASLTSKRYDCVIFNFEQFGTVQVKLIEDIRCVAKVTKVLVFTDTAEQSAAETFRSDPSSILIEKIWLNPEKDLAGLCDRLIKGGTPSYYREAIRHPVDEIASVTLLATGRHYSGRVKDISEKGACVEINTTTVKAGDKVKVVIQLERLNRERVIFAEIRWVKNSPGRSLTGLRFIKPDN